MAKIVLKNPDKPSIKAKITTESSRYKKYLRYSFVFNVLNSLIIIYLLTK